MIGKMVGENHRNWPSVLPIVMAAYRSGICRSTGFSPNKLFLGRELVAPLDLVMGDCYLKEDAPECHEYVYEQGQQIQSTFAMARETMQRQAEIRAHGYNMRVRPATFEVGQFVWMYYPRRRQKLT